MGIVYRAHHVDDPHTAYAVKVLLESLASDVSFITRFMREARVIAALHHPNIIRVFDHGHQGEHIFFSMEYFEGVTVAHLLRERKRLPAPQVIEIAAQAADALAYAHTHGHVIHRDIKPENLLVDRWFRVKLLDFGLARIDGTQRITQAGTVVGSLYYVSPEQLREQPIDARADVYALGISMYELLTGRRPYMGQTLQEMTDAILHTNAQPPRKLEPSVPPVLNDIVLRAMARDLDARIPSAGALRDELRALQTAHRFAQEPPARQTPLSSPGSDYMVDPGARGMGEPRTPTNRPVTGRPASGQPAAGSPATGRSILTGAPATTGPATGAPAPQGTNDISEEPTRAHIAPNPPRTLGPRTVFRANTLQPLPRRRSSGEE